MLSIRSYEEPTELTIDNADNSIDHADKSIHCEPEARIVLGLGRQTWEKDLVLSEFTNCVTLDTTVWHLPFFSGRRSPGERTINIVSRERGWESVRRWHWCQPGKHHKKGTGRWLQKRKSVSKTARVEWIWVIYVKCSSWHLKRGKSPYILSADLPYFNSTNSCQLCTSEISN